MSGNKYVKVEDARRIAGKYAYNIGSENCANLDIDLAMRFTENVVEVVRCQDCIRYGTEKCFIHIERLWELKPTDFCSYGEKKREPWEDSVFPWKQT